MTHTSHEERVTRSQSDLSPDMGLNKRNYQASTNGRLTNLCRTIVPYSVCSFDINTLLCEWSTLVIGCRTYCYNLQLVTTKMFI